MTTRYRFVRNPLRMPVLEATFVGSFLLAEYLTTVRVESSCPSKLSRARATLVAQGERRNKPSSCCHLTYAMELLLKCKSQERLRHPLVIDFDPDVLIEGQRRQRARV